MLGHAVACDQRNAEPLLERLPVFDGQTGPLRQTDLVPAIVCGFGLLEQYLQNPAQIMYLRGPARRYLLPEARGAEMPDHGQLQVDEQGDGYQLRATDIDRKSTRLNSSH